MATRRRFLLAAGAAALAAGFGVEAQAPRRRIGWLSTVRASDSGLYVDAFREGLRDLGYREGRDFVVEAAWGDESDALSDERIAALVASKPDVVVAQGAATRFALRHAKAVPVVFGFSGDPIEAGLVKSFPRPGGNFTGVAFLTLELVGKRVELLRETLPRARRLAVVAFPQHPGDEAERRASQAAADRLGLAMRYFDVRSVAQLDAALAAIEKSGVDAVMLFPVQTVISRREHIAAWAARNRIPTMSGWSEFAEAGNLMTYGPNLAATYRRLAAYADRILKGAQPAEIPVEYPSRVELVVNLKAAKALGVAVPRPVLLRADRVIE
jgi:putative ABC transport system substrate-binding protein